MPQQPCHHCGKAIDANARFCPYCGQATAVYGGPCPYCGRAISANARFCPHCGRQMGGQRGPEVQAGAWQKSPDEFAVRVGPADLQGVLKKEVEIQPGQQALLMVDGSADFTPKGPGRYTLETLFDKVLHLLGGGRHLTALVVDTSYTQLDFTLPKIYTRDDHEVTVRCVLGVAVGRRMEAGREVSDAPVFFINVMKGSRSVTLADLRNHLFAEVRDAVQEVVGKADFRGLAGGVALKTQLALAVEQHLRRTLQASGLALGAVHTVEVTHPRLDALRRQWEEIEIARQQAEADQTQARERRIAQVRQRNAEWQAQLEAEDQETLEQRARARLLEERATVYDEIRRAVASDKMNTVKSEEDYKDFLAGIDKRKTLRQEELDTLAEDFANRKADRQKARAHAAYLAELERDYNRKQAELVWKTDFTLAQLADELKVAQQRLADEGLLDEQRWQNDLAGLGRQADKADWARAEQAKADVFRRKTERDELDHRQQLDLARAQMDAQLAAIRGDSRRSEAEKDAASRVVIAEYEAKRQRILHDEQLRQEAAEDAQDMVTANQAVDLLAKMKQNKLAAEEAARRIAREDELARLRAAQEAEQAKRDAELRAKAQDQAHELAMLQARAQMSAEALMSLSGAEQARAIADLKKTDAMKGLSDEQVYALMAAQSPAVAQALAERFKALAAKPQEMDAQTRALYERMLTDLQQNHAKDAELRARTEERFQQMFDKALDSQRTGMTDIAKATSAQGANQGPQVVVVPTGSGSPQVIQTAGAGSPPAGNANKVQVCPRCRVETAVGVKFCTNCGHAFF